MAQDAYQFEAEALDPSELLPIVKKLKAAPKGKDSLIKLLKQLGDALEKAPQDVACLGKSRQDVANILAAENVLGHQDKDVRLYAARCLSQLLRVFAPESPYDDETLEEVFKLLWWCFKRLQQAQAPTFTLCLSLLQITARVKSYFLLLDLGNEELTMQAFDDLLDSATEDNIDSVEVPMVEILAGLIEESDNPATLLEALMLHLLPPRKDANSAAYRVAQGVLKRIERPLQHSLQKLLTVMMEAPAGLPAGLRGQGYNLIYEVYLVCPGVLLPVLPHLQLELHDTDDSKRLQAVQLILRLVTLQDSSFAQDYPDVLKELLARSVDDKASIRLVVLGALPDLIKAAPDGKVEAAVVEAGAGRVLDPEEKVRIAALKAVCNIWCAHPRLLPAKPAHLDTCLLRLRDKKKGVQREAASGLLALFRTLAEAHSKGRLEAKVAVELWGRIPAVMLAYMAGDAALRELVLDGPLRSGLMPPSLSPAAAGQLWSQLFLGRAPMEQEGMLKLISFKASLQMGLLSMAHLRKQLSGRKPEERLPVEQRLQAACVGLAKQCSEPSKARELLTKLMDAKDNHVASQLMVALGYDSTPEERAAALKDVVQRLGSKSALGDMVGTWVGRAAPTLVTPAQLRAVLQACGDAGADADGEVLHMLERLGKAAPPLVVPLIPQLCQLLTTRHTSLLEPAALLLARAGPLYRKAQAMPGHLDRTSSLEVAMPRLQSLCQTGSRRSAKLAAQAICALTPSASVQAEVGRLCARLVKVLPNKDVNSPSVISVLAALSSIGRVAPTVFEGHVKQVADFVLDTYCSTPLQPARADMSEGALKGAALKALARALVPDADQVQLPAAYLGVVERLHAALLPLLDPDEESGLLQDETDEVQRAELRLAAATAVLRLARRHDRRLPPAVYTAACLTVQDPSTDTRRAFAAKLRRMLQLLAGRPLTHHLSAKYAAALALTAMDPVEEHKEQGKMTLLEFVVKRRQAAKVAAAASSSATSGRSSSLLQEHPEFLAPYLVYLLAHHPDCPVAGPGAEQEEQDSWAPFQLMMQCGLEPLLVAAGGQASCAMLPALLKMLRSIQRTRDGDEAAGCDPQLWAMADLGLVVARALARRELRGKAPAGEEYPGEVALPSSLYRMPREGAVERKREGAYLPTAYMVQLDAPMFGSQAPNAERPASASKKRTRQRQRQPAAAAASSGEEGSEGEEEEEEQEAAGKRLSPAAQRKRAAGAAGTPAAAGGSGQKRARSKTSAGGSGSGQKRKRTPSRKAGEDSEDEGQVAAGASEDESQEVLPVSWRAAAVAAGKDSGGKEAPAGRSKSAAGPAAGTKAGGKVAQPKAASRPAAVAAAAGKDSSSKQAAGAEPKPAARPAAARKRAAEPQPPASEQSDEEPEGEAAGALSPDPYDLPPERPLPKAQPQARPHPAKQPSHSPDTSEQPKQQRQQQRRAPDKDQQGATHKAGAAAATARGKAGPVRAAAKPAAPPPSSPDSDQEEDVAMDHDRPGPSAGARQQKHKQQAPRPAAQPAKRARAAAGSKAAAAAAAASDQHDAAENGADSDEDAPPSAAKRGRRQQSAAAASSKAAAGAGAAGRGSGKAVMLSLPSSPSDDAGPPPSPGPQMPSPPKAMLASRAGRASRRR